MDTVFSRNELYWGEDFQQHLKNLKIAVFGLGGVGGFALEALARAGIGHFLIVDFDTVSTSNINRQLIATNSTVGRKKTELFKQRLFDINPDIKLQIYDGFYREENNEKIFCNDFALGKIDFIADAIDTVKSKIELIKFAKLNNINIISSMGAGNRMDGTKLFVSDISEIQALGGAKDSFIKNILHKLKKYADVECGLAVVASSERAHNIRKIKTVETIKTDDGLSVEYTKFIPASTPIVPAIAGYLMADYILKTCYNNFSNLKS